MVARRRIALLVIIRIMFVMCSSVVMNVRDGVITKQRLSSSDRAYCNCVEYCYEPVYYD